jgi:peptidyl-prolyl cis-trans isomerase C
MVGLTGMLLSATVVVQAADDGKEGDAQITTSTESIESAVGQQKTDNADNKTEEKKGLDYIAIVGGERIGLAEYIGELRTEGRKRFFHGKIPEEEQKQFRKEIAENLVDRLLLVREAKRRGVEPDMAAVDERLEVFDEQFKDNPDWPKARDKVLERLKQRLQGESLAERLEKRVRDVTEPADTELRAYYEANHKLFTTPERAHVSVILLKVDPSSSSDVWQQASKEAADILERINKGADFAEMARIHSGDESAQNDGDMGFIHAGMMGVNAQKVLDLMEPGEISAPVVLLEGVAIFRLEGRSTPELNPFEVVRERAAKLYQREKAEQAWTSLLAKLRTGAKIEYNDAPWR